MFKSVCVCVCTVNANIYKYYAGILSLCLLQVKPQFQEILRLSEENVGKGIFSLDADVQV